MRLVYKSDVGPPMDFSVSNSNSYILKKYDDNNNNKTKQTDGCKWERSEYKRWSVLRRRFRRDPFVGLHCRVPARTSGGVSETQTTNNNDKKFFC